MDRIGRTCLHQRDINRQASTAQQSGNLGHKDWRIVRAALRDGFPGVSPKKRRCDENIAPTADRRTGLRRASSDGRFGYRRVPNHGPRASAPALAVPPLQIQQKLASRDEWPGLNLPHRRSCRDNALFNHSFLSILKRRLMAHRVDACCGEMDTGLHGTRRLLASRFRRATCDTEEFFKALGRASRSKCRSRTPR